MIQTVKPVATLKGTLQLPSDKSISHRSALFAAISSGESTIDNYSSAADPQSTLACLEQLGVKIKKNADTVQIQGVGRTGFKTPESPLDCGNSGTTMRLLSGIVAGAGVECKLIGDESLSARTMTRILDPLKKMGCSIEARDGKYAPIKVGKHQGVKEIRFPLPIASAQLKSSVLLAGLFGEKPTEVIENTLSRDHTERLLDLKSEPYGEGKIIRSSGNDEIPEQTYRVPGDFSAASFWMVGAAIHQDAEIVLKGVGMNPSRTAALVILEEMGANIEVSNEKMEGKEPVADLTISSSELSPINLDPKLIPNCIDELPILMVAMSFAKGISTITGAEELRHKETDRLSAMNDILISAGVNVELESDGMTIHGDPDFIPEGAEFTTYHDHRMAMASAILASASLENSTVKDAECTAISYPEFWSDLAELSV
ncbi:MAG: 3-phosphoshikimate 1-carboxyvinyltransferase [Balneolaceae bacterium]